MPKIATGAGWPELSVPRTCQRQTQRSNVIAETPKDYWRRSVFLPFLDHLLTELSSRFSAMTKAAVGGLRHFFPKIRNGEWMSNGCALTCFRPMKSISQRQNTSVRSFGFGRPSGAASRLHEMKAPSTVEDTLAEECFRTRAFISKCFASPEAAAGHPRNNRVRGAC